MRVAMPRNCLNVTRISVPFGSGAREPGLYCSEWDHRAESRRDRLFRRDQCRLASEQLTSASGRVTRASPVQTAVRNCTRDEGRSFGFGNQVLIPSHRKLLRLNVVVVSVAETSGR
jgi:hypothetical protein